MRITFDGDSKHIKITIASIYIYIFPFLQFQLSGVTTLYFIKTRSIFPSVYFSTPRCIFFLLPALFLTHHHPHPTPLHSPNLGAVAQLQLGAALSIIPCLTFLRPMLKANLRTLRPLKLTTSRPALCTNFSHEVDRHKREAQDFNRRCRSSCRSRS